MVWNVLEGNKPMATLDTSARHAATPTEPLTKQVGEDEVGQIAIAFIVGSVAIATVLLATAVILYLKYC